MIQPYDSLIVKKVTQLLIPMTRLFAIYVLFHGHYSPGGGFQAGVLIGASIILKLLVESKQQPHKFAIQREFGLAAAGLGLYTSVGIAAMFGGGEFLDYGRIYWLASGEASRHYFGILIAEIGITLVVAMTLVIIFHILAFLPEKEKASS